MRLTSFGKCGLDQHLTAEPTPVDAVAVDFAIAVLHEFEDIYLVAVQGLARVFPDEDVAAGVVVGIAVSAHPFVRAAARPFCEEGADFRLAAQSAVCALHDDRHQRRFEFSVIIVEGDKSIGVAAFGGVMPSVVEIFGGVHGSSG